MHILIILINIALQQQTGFAIFQISEQHYKSYTQFSFYKNPYITFKQSLMKFAQIAIGSILAIEAILLLYSPQQRYNFHTFIDILKEQFKDCSCWEKVGYDCVQKVRLFVVALLVSGAFSLTLGNNLIVGFIAQLIWTITQSECYYSCGMKQTRNTLVQVFFSVVLISQMINQCQQCKRKQQYLKRKASIQQQQRVLTEQANKKTQKKTQMKKDPIQNYKREDKQSKIKKKDK